jgi:Flp pilus assembly protein TadG
VLLKKANSKQRRGVASVELAALLPLIVLLLLGLWEVGRLVDVQQSVSNAAREAGRAASTGARTITEVQAAATNYLARVGFPTANVTVTVTNLTSSSRPDPSTADQLDRFQIVVTLPFNDVRWVMINQFTAGHVIRAETVWSSMRDVPVAISTAVPTG